MSGALVDTGEASRCASTCATPGGERLARSARRAASSSGDAPTGGWGDLGRGPDRERRPDFPYASEWRPGRHVLPLRSTTVSAPGPCPTRTSLLAYLILPLAARPSPRSGSPPGGGPRVRTRFRSDWRAPTGGRTAPAFACSTPRGLVAPDPPAEVDVPGPGRSHGGRGPASRHGARRVAAGHPGRRRGLDGPSSGWPWPRRRRHRPRPAWLPVSHAPLLARGPGLARRRRSRRRASVPLLTRGHVLTFGRSSRGQASNASSRLHHSRPDPISKEAEPWMS